ncbi:ATP-binding protein [Pectobacterium brasiliense]|uniref:ATP-binding protein n=1 Tax=Pectobacterium brasiliense TaxID=180957 RepID=UPI00301A1484
MSILVGEVIAIHGIKITLEVFEDSNKDTLFYDGKKYKGISIKEYIKVKRGFRDIVCIVEGEHLDELRYAGDHEKKYYIRKVELRPIGYFDKGIFNEGVKYLPLIKDQAYLLEEDKLSDIYGEESHGNFVIGKLLKEELPVSLPWQKVFNTHIGIFGNTGSGKSNTLTKLYTTLFEQKIQEISGKSKFIIIDFNGEYTTNQLVSDSFKCVYKLNTRNEENKFPLSSTEFWDTETLSILFQATQNTQKPFINRIITGRERYADYPDSFLNYIKKTYELIFTSAQPKPDSLDLIREITELMGFNDLLDILKKITWHSQNNCFYGNFLDGSGYRYFNSEGNNYNIILSQLVNNIVLPEMDAFEEFKVRSNIQLIRDLIYGYVQYEFIQPLLKRIESSLNGLRKVIDIVDVQAVKKPVTIISLRKCKPDIKKVLPLLIAKHYYHPHKDKVANPPDSTVHLIIDEAHNILSQQSSRESESWKDYRLEMFEEIIKEGRKFGVFLTLSSQRPADISPTIVSQIHNFFIHRLVNDRDLLLIDNTISTLDNMSRSMIPNLSKGCCIVTGTSFNLPMLLQVDLLERSKQPDSEDVDLEKIWKIAE